MCRRLLLISTVVVAAFVTVAQGYTLGGQQSSGIFGIGGTYSAQGAGLGFSNDNSFQTDQNSEFSKVGCCNNTWMGESNSGFIDQGTAAFGCGGCRAAGQLMTGGGSQGQQTGYVPSTNGVTCYPFSTQGQVLGGSGTQSMFNTCGNGAALASQAGAVSESQNITTPSTSGSEYQYLAGSQSGVAYGVPTSFSSASGAIGGGGAQCQSFGGISVP
jgi:hypothetical protein